MSKTPRFDAAYKECLDDTGAITRLEPLYNLAKQLEIALNESVKLQAHYGKLLNMHDGGYRITFDSAEAWIARLKQTGDLK